MWHVFQRKDSDFSLYKKLVIILICGKEISFTFPSNNQLISTFSRFQLALYTRKVLNVRVVSTFMLSFAAFLPSCRPYIKKYFNQIIALPSEWISVAELYQVKQVYHFRKLYCVLVIVFFVFFSNWSFNPCKCNNYNKRKWEFKTIHRYL